MKVFGNLRRKKTFRRTSVFDKIISDSVAMQDFKHAKRHARLSTQLCFSELFDELETLVNFEFLKSEEEG